MLVELLGVVLASLVGFVIWDAVRGRIAPGEHPSLARRLLALAVCLALLFAGWAVVITAGCALDWIDQEECPA